MNNLLIGGTGFIGSALGLGLLARGQKVVSVSNSGQAAPRIKSVVIDLYREQCPKEILEAADTVFIMIGQIHSGFDANQEKQVLANLLYDLKESHARVFYFSTALVYGNTPARANETTLCRPIDNYATFKLEAETIFRDNILPERLMILRLANIYGPYQNKGFIGLLMKKLQEPNPSINLNGDGLQKRDYVFIDDLVQAIMTIADKPSESGVVNISTGSSHTLIQVVDLASKISGKKIKYNVTHSVVNETKENIIDNSRLKTVFHYDSFTRLETGLSQTIKRSEA